MLSKQPMYLSPPFLQDASYKNAQKLGRGVGLDNIHAFKNHYSG